MKNQLFSISDLTDIINGNATNCFDTIIALAICLTIAIIVTVAVCKWFEWKNRLLENDKEAAKIRRTEELENLNRTARAELQCKLFNVLEDEIKDVKEEHYSDKAAFLSARNAARQKYITELRTALEDKQNEKKE